MYHMTSKAKKKPMDPFTQAVAAVLTAALKDNWKKFPKQEDFCKAAAALSGVNKETIARLLRAENSIRVDYLDHMAVLLGTRASVLIAAAEQIVRPAQPTIAAPLSDEAEAQMSALRNGERPGGDRVTGT